MRRRTDSNVAAVAPSSDAPMIVLGIDPGTAALGYGIVERTGSRLRLVDAGCLETPRTWGLPQRLLAIHRLVVDEIELHRPDIMAVERLFFSKNAQTAFAVGQELTIGRAPGCTISILDDSFLGGQGAILFYRVILTC